MRMNSQPREPNKVKNDWHNKTISKESSMYVAKHGLVFLLFMFQNTRLYAKPTH